MSETEVQAGGRRVRISHADKMLFPGDGITKGDLVDYYVRVAEVMVPHVRDRPLTQHRWPDGLGGEDFWHKQIPKYFPEWIERVEVETNKGPQQQVLANDPAVLAYLANQNCITPHTWMSRRDRLNEPDLIVFDLDPATERDFGAVRAAARLVREILTDLGLVPFVKTTGSKGLHVTVPIRPDRDFESVHGFAAMLAELLVNEDPGHLTTEFYKRKREGRIFVDIHRNAYAQTAVPPYAVRARAGAPVAAPIEWDELGRVTPSRFTIRNLDRRLRQRGDPWAGMHRRARSLGRAEGRLRKLLPR
ncbi:MAG TPA: non-homologous end-joining DNA ligase [Actinomycetota bacterium]|nr:non-homologous end-joining DNA ligase [Actinomycetota bacterium]